MSETDIAARIYIRRQVALWFSELRTRSSIKPDYKVKIGGQEIKLSDLEHTASSIPLNDLFPIMTELGATPPEILKKITQLNSDLGLMGFKPLREPQKTVLARVLPLYLDSNDSQSSETVS